MDKKMNTTIDFEFYDGSTAKLTLFFYALYQLKEKNKSLYERCNRIMTKGTEDVLEMITMLYTAYCAANIDDYENLMSEEEFMFKCGSDIKAVAEAVKQLMSPKKQKASGNRSSKEREPENKG